MDVAIVVGHHPDSPGAALRVGGRTIHEYDLWLPFGQALVDTFDDGRAELVTRPNPAPDAALAEKVNETGARCAIELHHNAAESSDALGTEMLHYPNSSGGKKLAHYLHEATVDALGTVRRGPKHRSDLVFLQQTEMPAVVCEPGFGSNAADAWALLTRQAPLLMAYKNALTRWLRGESV